MHGHLLPLFLLFFAPFLFSRAELDDFDLYPIIINTDGDKAVFVIPQIGCHVIQDLRILDRIIGVRQRQPNVYRTDGKTMDGLIDLCDLYQTDRINASQFVVGLREKSFLIFPGTHFCGAGNDAANYTDLGYYIETDKCCREHDSCMDFINGFSCHSTIPELCNSTPFTRSNCICDEKFRECLGRSNDTASVPIGLLYFTVFGLKCFRKDYPIIRCQEYGGFLNIHCQQYELDTAKEKVYQFFDSPKYSRGRVVASNNITTENYSFENGIISIN